MLRADTASIGANRFVEEAHTIEIVNPATGEIISHVTHSNLFELEQAVSLARNAFESWRLDLETRRSALRECAAALKRSQSDLAELIVQEQGKPIKDARSEVEYAASQFQLYAEMELPNRLLGETEKTRTSMALRPLGVAALITPWNYPIGTAAVKIAPALLVGNTLILKPSARTPLSAIRLVDLLNQYLPEGVLNLLIGGDQLGNAIARHPGIAKLSLTGSVKTGRSAMSAAASNLKRITLELGGNDPAIVLPDADPLAIADPIIDAAFRNAGQVCSAIKRLYIPESLKDGILDALLDSISRFRMGNGMDPRVNLGPLTNASALERIEYLVANALSRGGKLLCGGSRCPRPGNFYPPTLISNLDNGIALVDEEQFGPVLPIIAYRDVDTAIKKANDSSFGLSASVWTSNPARGEEVAQQLYCGRVGINGHKRSAVSAPFGGFKQSGLGRELGEWGLASMGEMQVINHFH